MSLVTHLVVAYDHESKTFTFDGDGSREWIRVLFTPETNTWSYEAEDWVRITPDQEQEALDALKALGVTVDADWWVTR
jgi:hypothetical protein